MWNSDRNYDDPQYKQWRLRVKRRDRFCCRMCGSKIRLHVHHIKRWADFPSLRFVISNGITLCHRCHKTITGNEDYYESQFVSLIGSTEEVDVILNIIMNRYNNGNNK